MQFALPGDGDRWPEAECQGARDRHRSGGEEHRDVDPNVIEPRELNGSECDEQAKKPGRERDSGQAA